MTELGTSFALVDAFTTHRAFSGNPAGVVVVPEFPDDAWMQGVADELQQAETAFVVPDSDGGFRLRWFTPVAEVALCGHATLASAHWLWESGVLSSSDDAVFSTRSGRLTASQEDGLITLDFPAVPAQPVEPSTQLLTALSGVTPVWTGLTQHQDPGERNMLAVLPSAAAVRSLVPDLPAVEQLPAGGLIVTARDAGAGPSAVLSRYFAPAYGIPEDPVTGSAHCTIGPYWTSELGPALRAHQASRRGGDLTVTTTTSGSVLLAGSARTAAEGHLRPSELAATRRQGARQHGKQCAR